MDFQPFLALPEQAGKGLRQVGLSLAVAMGNSGGLGQRLRDLPDVSSYRRNPMGIRQTHQGRIRTLTKRNAFFILFD